MCSLEIEFSQAVKLSIVARKRTQVNFKMLYILLKILSGKETRKHALQKDTQNIKKL